MAYGTSANPTIAGNHTHDGTGEGNYISIVSGLNASTVYHVRAYVTNASGTAYGSDISFTTPAFSYVILADTTRVTSGGKFVIY
jgi:hypothetical protein